jgi:hypothetical protein
MRVWREEATIEVEGATFRPSLSLSLKVIEAIRNGLPPCPITTTQQSHVAIDFSDDPSEVEIERRFEVLERVFGTNIPNAHGGEG